MNPYLDSLVHTTRRHFLKESAVGLGAIALSSLLGRNAMGAPLAATNPLAARLPHFAPKADEMKPLLALYTKSLERFSRDAKQAFTVATVPLGALAPDANPAELAAWTVVGNVLLNLDEFLMKP